MKQFGPILPGNFFINGLPFISSPFVINFNFFDMKKAILLIFSLYSFAVLKAEIPPQPVVTGPIPLPGLAVLCQNLFLSIFSNNYYK